MGAPDYMPEPETGAEKAAARRTALRMRGGENLLAAMPSRRGPNANLHDIASVLDFEHDHPSREADGKEALIRKTFNCSAARYYQRLNYLITDGELEARKVNAQEVNRLQAVAAARHRPRTNIPEGYTS